MSRFRSFFRRFNPLNALGDLGRELQTPYPHRFKIIAVALALTIGLFSVMWQEGGAGLPLPPKVVYVDSYLPGRTEAEIVAGNVAATKASRAAAAEEAAKAERIRQMYKTLGRVSGMDVEAIEAKAEAERAAEARERAANAAAMPKARVARVNE
ncbi:MAG: hypothetical protein LC648_04830 [Novosphingobium sp.]|nr:hypothetical protein [Novosphingobium sp.]